MNKNQIGFVYEKDGITFIIEKMTKNEGSFNFKLMYKKSVDEMNKWKSLSFSNTSQEVVQSTYWHWIDYLSERGLSKPKNWEQIGIEN